MDKALFEKLLNEQESPTLDVKTDQYRFAKATEEEKSELLKDILGFANTRRRSDAYILIGVAEVRGGRHRVVGIAPTDHLDDHALQQFVNNLTNRPVQFQYEAFGFEGKQVGIIRIEQQQSPIYLRRDYGKLKRGQVYPRRGTSTDPSKPASPEEIAMMGQPTAPPSARLTVEFADTTRDRALGSSLTWDAEFLETPPHDEIPLLEDQRHHFAGISLPALDPSHMVNPHYLRELAAFQGIRRLFRPVRLVVSNVGEVAAKQVRCELVIPANVGVGVLDEAARPDPPRRYRSIVDLPAVKGIRSVLGRIPGDVTIDQNDERYLIAMDCGDLQPGRRVWSEVFYAGKVESGEFELAGRIYAENLPQLEQFTLTISANVTLTHMTVSELEELPEPPESS